MIAITSIRVLIADPNQVLGAVYKEYLSQRNFLIATASDGVECLEQLRRFRPHVLVLEPELPMGGGDGVLALMREDTHMTLVPVMVLTATRNRGLLYRVIGFRVDSMRSKPLPPSELAEEIRRLLEHPCEAGTNGRKFSRSGWA